MASSRYPVIAAAVKERLQVAAIDFGTTYSGYALSFRSDFVDDPLKIMTNQWKSGAGRPASLKTSSCILFRPDQSFDSFGFEAEDKYAELAMDEAHFDWFYFKRFKMLLYENKDLNRSTMLKDDKGLEMPAMAVFTEGIRYLKDKLIESCEDRSYGLHLHEIHWVITVPAIWDDTAKQFMREAAINAGIETDHLSLALEPEAASLFCKYLPVEKVKGATGGGISCFAPGKRYLVLDAGGGTVDITIHETQRDHTVRELYKANGGPWGGTKIDEAFINFLTDITGPDVMEMFQRDHTDDFLDLMREFEIKKTGFAPDSDQKITFKMPISIHEIFQTVRGEDFRRSLISKHDLRDQVTFAGDKLRVQSGQVKTFFTETCGKIVSHLNDIFNEGSVCGTDTILMVGGFSESKMLQEAIRNGFPDKKIIVPAEAGLAVLKGAVIFGHSPKAIASRVARHTYGIKINKTFNRAVHPYSKMMIVDYEEQCTDCFDKHVEIGQEVKVGLEFDEKSYIPSSRNQTSVNVKVYTSDKKSPEYVDEPGCNLLGNIVIDVSDIDTYEERNFVVKMIYGDTELGLEARVLKTGRVLNASFDFLG
ncbi:heat shock 70 kDa protein 12B-like [Mercenaria mercenaria]|uniref:heat shock 70 kDa protein 12B-like n=1 Tax=Mercenaria mercenaria TaxID=6596 RepID=UPI00234E8928|nr:heat shock 70 kDa protein 12B-like [Mercenaria mercenaria]